MAEREYYVGSVGPLVYDDTDTYLTPDDPGYDPTDTIDTMKTAGCVQAAGTPTKPNHLTRLTDLTTALADYVKGPATAAGNNLAAFNGTTGKLIKDSGLAMGLVVLGPASTTGDHLAAFNGVTGQLIKDSGLHLGVVVNNPAKTSVNHNIAQFNGTTGLIIEDSGVLATDVVVGPASSTNYNLPKFADITGKLLADSGKDVRDVVTNAAKTSVDHNIAQFNGTNGVAIEDSARSITQIPRGYVPCAYPVNFSGSAAYTDALSLPADGGCVAIPIRLTGRIYLQSVSVRSLETANEHTFGWAVYLDPYTDYADRVAYSAADYTWTAVAVGNVGSAADGAPILLAPGLYWLVVQNRHATNTFSVGTFSGVSAFCGNIAQTRLATNPCGATLQMTGVAWTKITNIVAARLNARVFGDSAAF